jgi:ribosomal protein S18 acetylase RimI-like enzyme
VAFVWRATPDQAGAVAGLLIEFRDWFGYPGPPDEAFHRNVGVLIADPGTEYLLAAEAEGGDPVGVCQLRYRLGVWRDGDDAWLEDLYVRGEAQGKGLGLALTQAAIDRSRARGAKRIQLDVEEENETARALYEKAGFSVKGKRALFLQRDI